jgi:hypothetical protein
MSQVTNNPPYLRVDEIFFGLDVARTEKMWVEARGQFSLVPSVWVEISLVRVRIRICFYREFLFLNRGTQIICRTGEEN